MFLQQERLHRIAAKHKRLKGVGTNENLSFACHFSEGYTATMTVVWQFRIDTICVL